MGLSPIIPTKLKNTLKINTKIFGCNNKIYYICRIKLNNAKKKLEYGSH